MTLFEVWGVHPESDSEWQEGGTFFTEEEAQSFLYSLGEPPDTATWEIRKFIV